ncbi:hypothetical protein AHF37_12141 [Paragonimus kellicotti]|nr:hypothetical protein AHF37_12141 [Paragonimus kellicotti]
MQTGESMRALHTVSLGGYSKGWLRIQKMFEDTDAIRLFGCL